MRKLFLRVYNDESKVIQTLESNYIDIKCLYSQKRLIFQKRRLLLQQHRVKYVGAVDHTQI